MKSNGKIYFLADAHLGAKYHKNRLDVERRLVRWLEKVRQDATAIYFLGDMFDYWYDYKYVAPKGFVRFLGKLGEMADEGIEIHLFTGNHDIWMFDYLPSELGAVIHRDMLAVELLGRKFILGHGDEVDYRSRMLRFLRVFFRNRFCQWLYAGIHPRWTFGFALRWSHSSRLNGLKKEAAPLKGEQYLIDFVQGYLKTHPDTNFFIFGHLHTMLDYEFENYSRLLVVGDWIKHFSFAEWDGNKLSLKKFE